MAPAGVDACTVRALHRNTPGLHALHRPARPAGQGPRPGPPRPRPRRHTPPRDTPGLCIARRDTHRAGRARPRHALAGSSSHAPVAGRRMRQYRHTGRISPCR